MLYSWDDFWDFGCEKNVDASDIDCDAKEPSFRYI